MVSLEVWIKLLHLGFMAVWIGVLFYMPRLLLSHSLQRAVQGTDSGDEGRMIGVEEFLFFYVATPGAILTILFGIWLTAYGIEGGWLPLKLVCVTLLTLLHLYVGQIILAFRGGEARHGRLFYHALAYVLALLLVAAVYLALAKPI